MINPTVEPRWRKARACGNGTCVEVAEVAGKLLVRDSKDPRGVFLSFTADEWAAFVVAVKADEFTF